MSNNYILRNQGCFYHTFYHTGRKPWINLQPGTLYTKRRNHYPRVYMMDESIPRLLGQWPSFWHYPPPGPDSPVEPSSGACLTGGKGVPLMYTGECLMENSANAWQPNQYFVFLLTGVDQVNKVLVEKEQLWQLKEFRLNNK